MFQENKPQLENNPEWLAEYRKDGMDLQQQTGEKFWKQVDHTKHYTKLVYHTKQVQGVPKNDL